MDNSKSEKYVEAYLSRKIKEMGGWAIKLLPFNINGLPDKICLLPGGKIFFAETKSTGKSVRKLQGKIHTILRNMDFFVYVIDSTSQVDQILKGNPWSTLNIDLIMLVVSRVTEIPIEQILRKRVKTRDIIRARQLVQYFANCKTSLTLTEIGKKTGGFSHSTVSHGCKTISDLYDVDKEVRSTVDKIESALC